MPVYRQGPINIQQGNSAAFAVEFLDSDGELTVPLTANLQISYVNLTNSTVTETVALSETNEFFTGIWSSTSAALGLATWVATGTSTDASATGQLRILQRQSTY